MGWYDKDIVRANKEIIVNGELNVYLQDVIKYIQENNIQHMGFDEVNRFFDNELSADEIRILLNQLLELKVLSGNGRVILDFDISKVQIEKYKEKWCQEKRKKEEWNRKLDEKIKKRKAVEDIIPIPEDEKSTSIKEERNKGLDEEMPKNSSCGCFIAIILVSIILYILTNDYLGVTALIPFIVIIIMVVIVLIKDNK